MSRTVVMLHPGGLGDLLLAVPAIQNLRQRFPSNEFVLCAQAQAAELLWDCGLVDRWLSVQSTACTALFGGMLPDDPILRDWLSRCDFAVAWTRDDTGAVAAALTACGTAAVVVESPFAQSLSSIHQSERLVEIVGGQANQTLPAPLSLPEALRLEAKRYLAACHLPQRRPLAMVHAGSGSRHKCVTPVVWLPVLEGLEAEGFEAVLLEGPADHEMLARLLIQWPSHPPLLSGLSVRLLAGVLSELDLFIGHDSGVTHLAGLVGTPTVALFGPTDPIRWAPRGPAVTVLRSKPCECVSWDAVRSCAAKPCLDLSPQVILAACRAPRTAAVNPRIS
jgi:heptosyltransferase III